MPGNLVTLKNVKWQQTEQYTHKVLVTLTIKYFFVDIVVWFVVEVRYNHIYELSWMHTTESILSSRLWSVPPCYICLAYWVVVKHRFYCIEKKAHRHQTVGLSLASEILIPTGSGNRLMPVKHQTITWTNTNMLFGNNELKLLPHVPPWGQWVNHNLHFFFFDNVVCNKNKFWPF